jgi:hypothetical protein
MAPQCCCCLSRATHHGKGHHAAAAHWRCNGGHARRLHVYNAAGSGR